MAINVKADYSSALRKAISVRFDKTESMFCVYMGSFKYNTI